MNATDKALAALRDSGANFRISNVRETYGVTLYADHKAHPAGAWGVTLAEAINRALLKFENMPLRGTGENQK